MPRSSKSSSDFENRFFDQLIDRLDKQDNDRKEDRKLLEAVHAQTQKTNGRVTKLEGEVGSLSQAAYDVPAKKDLPSLIRDPKVIQIALYVSLAILLVVAYITKFDVAGIIG